MGLVPTDASAFLLASIRMSVGARENLPGNAVFEVTLTRNRMWISEKKLAGLSIIHACGVQR